MIDRRDVLKVMGGGLVAGLIPWRSARAAAGGHQPVGYLRTNWRNDPFSLGSYSYIAKGATRRDIRALAKPVDNRLFFAGEATHPKYNSTVHAAFESGLIAAEQILPLSYEHVAVVGAGMSGLAAAHRLREAGVNIHVFEARDRIGGRMNTDHSLGTPLDLGASWIHGINNNPLYDMATELDLELLTTDGSYISRGKNGRKIPDNELPSWLENVTSVQHDAGADIDQINLLAYARDRDYTGDEVVFAQGYTKLLDALAPDQRSISLSATVTGIDVSSGPVTLTLKDGTTGSFDAAIVTVPLGTMKAETIRFTPDLPLSKQRAIKRLGMGTLDKVYLQFETPFWDTDVTWIATPENGLPQGHFNEWLNVYKYLGTPIIMAFNGGTPALDLSSLSDEVIVEKALSTLNGAYPVVEP